MEFFKTLELKDFFFYFFFIIVQGCIGPLPASV